MPDMQDAVVVLTEAEVIQEARRAVERAKKQTWDLFDGMDAHDAYRLGKLQEALDGAEDALFNVLNVASSHLHCSDSKRMIDAWLVRDTDQPDVEAVS